jgi:hypothetical protein
MDYQGKYLMVNVIVNDDGTFTIWKMSDATPSNHIHNNRKVLASFPIDWEGYTNLLLVEYHDWKDNEWRQVPFYYAMR